MMASIVREYLGEPGGFDPVPISTAAPTSTKAAATVNGGGLARLR
jgi:hypothetical protein